MKAYKRFLLVLLTFVLTVSLCGCIIIPITEYYEYSPEEVISIQLYDLRDPAFHHDPSLCEPVYTIPEERKEEFLRDFSELKFSDQIIITIAAVDPSFYYDDWVVRINLTSGLYVLHSSGGYGQTFDAEGNFIESTHLSCEDADLENLVKKYYEIPLP